MIIDDLGDQNFLKGLDVCKSHQKIFEENRNIFYLDLKPRKNVNGGLGRKGLSRDKIG